MTDDIKMEKPEKNLNGRIEDLVEVMERRFSYGATFGRGIVQGLGFIIGSTIVAGIGYTLLTKFISPEAINDMTINAVLQKGVK